MTASVAEPRSQAGATDRFFAAGLAEADPEVAAAVRGELRRQ